MTRGNTESTGRPRKLIGKRAAQALAFIASEPGITIPALGEKMGIKTNYLYTVVSSLERADKVRKAGCAWRRSPAQKRLAS